MGYSYLLLETKDVSSVKEGILDIPNSTLVGNLEMKSPKNQAYFIDHDIPFGKGKQQPNSTDFDFSRLLLLEIGVDTAIEMRLFTREREIDTEIID